MKPIGKYYNRVQVYLADDVAKAFESFCKENNLTGSAAAKKIISNFLLKPRKLETDKYFTELKNDFDIKELQREVKELRSIVLENQQKIEQLTQGGLSLDSEFESEGKEENTQLVTDWVDEFMDDAKQESTDESPTELVTESPKEVIRELYAESLSNSVIELQDLSQIESTNELATESQEEFATESQTESQTELKEELKQDENSNSEDDLEEVLEQDVPLRWEYILKGGDYETIQTMKFKGYYVLWNLDYGKNHPFVLGGRKKAVRTDNLFHCRLYSSRKRVEKALELYNKKFSCEFVITDARNILDLLEPRDRLKLLKYWKKEHLFKKQVPVKTYI